MRKGEEILAGEVRYFDGTCRLSSLTGNAWRRNSLDLPKGVVGPNGTAPSAAIHWNRSGRCRAGDRAIVGIR